LASQRDSAALVAAAAAGDAESFDLLVGEHAAQVYRLALRMLGSPEDAEDVQQEAFVLAYRHLRDFRGDASFGTWVCSIAARLCLSRKRRRVRHSSARPEDLPARHADPEERMLAVEAAALVQETLLEMAPADRLLIVLKCIEGFSHEEIARVLRCSVESSRARLARARRLFRERYERRQAGG
jgi:RNA polymerase sigma-70 factor (ECF subfamily)